MNLNTKILPGQGEPLSGHGRYRQLVGKFNCLTVTPHGVTFPINIVS